jgi:hypothetical protein
MTSIEPRQDVYTRITDRIVAALESGVRPWVKPWSAEHAAGRITRPLRYNGQPYSRSLARMCARLLVLKRKAELQEERCQRAIEEDRRRRERQSRLEQARIDHLLAQAGALHQAGQIRAYVAAVRQVNDSAPEPMTAEALAAWAGWALAQADRIAPVLSGAYYKTRPVEAPE